MPSELFEFSVNGADLLLFVIQVDGSSGLRAGLLVSHIWVEGMVNRNHEYHICRLLNC